MTAPIPPPVSHSYNDDDDGGPNIVLSDTEADPKSFCFSFANLRFYLKANVAAGIPTWRCNQGESGKLFSQFYILIQGVHPTQIWIQAQRAVGIPLT